MTFDTLFYMVTSTKDADILLDPGLASWLVGVVVVEVRLDRFWSDCLQPLPEEGVRRSAGIPLPPTAAPPPAMGSLHRGCRKN